MHLYGHVSFPSNDARSWFVWIFLSTISIYFVLVFLKRLPYNYFDRYSVIFHHSIILIILLYTMNIKSSFVRIQLSAVYIQNANFHYLFGFFFKELLNFWKLDFAKALYQNFNKLAMYCVLLFTDELILEEHFVSVKSKVPVSTN